VDWRSSPRGADLRPAIVIKDKKGEILKLPRGGEARYLLSADAILSVEPGSSVTSGDVLARIPLESAKTRDITGGLPRVAELFEARRPKDHAIIAEISGACGFGRDYKNKRRIRSSRKTSDGARRIPDPEGQAPSGSGRRLHREGRVHPRRSPGTARHPCDQGRGRACDLPGQRVQEVYRLQGVSINDKHIEVIVRQMLQKVEITDAGTTSLLSGEQIDRTELDEINAKPRGRWWHAGIRCSGSARHHQGQLQTRSFISAASFQETTRVLTEAAISGKVDTLEGLKENVIVGRLIPAGTGGMKKAAFRGGLFAWDMKRYDREVRKGVNALGGAAGRQFSRTNNGDFAFHRALVGGSMRLFVRHVLQHADLVEVGFGKAPWRTVRRGRAGRRCHRRVRREGREPAHVAALFLADLADDDEDRRRVAAVAGIVIV
jgi:DNA-directed RNA polymerase subunit beta'